MTDNNNSHDDDKAHRKTATILLLGVLAVLAAWAGSVALWGIPGLYIPALILVPVIFIVMMVGSRG